MRAPLQYSPRTEPTAQPQQGQQIGGVSSSAFGALSARAGGNLGQAFSGLAEELEQQKTQLDRFNANTKFYDWAIAEQQRGVEFNRGAPLADPDYTTKRLEAFKNSSEKFLSSLPPGAVQDEMRLRVKQIEQGVSSGALERQFAGIDAHQTQVLSNNFQKAREIVDNDYSQYETQINLLLDQLEDSALPEASPDPKAITKESLAREFEYALLEAQYKAMSRDAQIGIGELGDRATQDYYDRLRAVEGTGKAKGSNAEGFYQFVPGTWKEHFDEVFPEFRDLPEAEKLALRKDRKYADAVAAHFTGKNADTLIHAGLPSSETNLYLAHFLGVEGAITVLGAPADGAISEYVSEAAIGANSAVFNKLTNIGDLRLWAARTIMGAKLPVNPAFASIPYNRRQALEQDALTEATAANNAEFKRQQAEVAGVMQNALNGIVDGTWGKADIEALRSRVSFEQYEKLTNTYKKYQEDNDLVRRFRDMSLAGMTINSADPKTTRMMDAVVGPEGLAAVESTDREYFTGNILPVIDYSKMIPEQLRGLLVGMAQQDLNPQKGLFALEALAQIQNAAPDAYAKLPDGLKLDIGYMRTVQATQTPQAIWEVLHPNRDATARQRVRELREEATVVLEEERKSDKAIINEVAGTGWLSSTPAVSSYAGHYRQLQHDYDQLYVTNYARFQDKEKAHESTIKQLQTVWGVSEVTGESLLMKRPPEKWGGGPGESNLVMGSHDWMGEQVRQDFKLTPTDKVQLYSDGETEAQILRGENPTYGVITFDEYGVPRIPAHPDGGEMRMQFQKTAEHAEMEDRYKKLEILRRQVTMAREDAKADLRDMEKRKRAEQLQEKLDVLEQEQFEIDTENVPRRRTTTGALRGMDSFAADALGEE